jgi:hypothetical protein
VSRVGREYAKDNGLVCADVNRLFNILLDGKDDATRATTAEYDFQGFPSLWNYDTNAFTLNNGELTPTPAGVTSKGIARNRTFYNGYITVDVKPSLEGDSGAYFIYYRLSDPATVYRHLGIIVKPGAGTGQILFYDTSGMLSYATNLNIPTGTFSTIRIEAYGTNHVVYLNGSAVLSIKNYTVLTDGIVYMGSNAQVPVFKNLRIGFNDPLSYKPVFTELDLLGEYGNPNSSGSGGNHPSGVGHAMCYEPSYLGTVKELGRRKENGVWTSSKFVSGGWTTLSAGWPSTTTAGEKIYCQTVLPSSHYQIDRGAALKRLDNGNYYTLSKTAISQATLANLEPGKFAYFPVGDGDIMFISVPNAGTVTWDTELYKFT